MREGVKDGTVFRQSEPGKLLDMTDCLGHIAVVEQGRGCLIGDFSLEAAPQSEVLRTRPAEIFAEWRIPFAACIAQAQAAGEIATFAPEEIAEFLLSSWEGAILRMKVARSAEPLERFKRITFATVFNEPQT